MRVTRPRVLIFGAVLLVVALVAYATHLSPEQRLVRDACSMLGDVLAADVAKAKSLRTTIELERADGLPKELAKAKFELALAGPERLRVAASVDRSPIVIGREGQQLWVHQPAKSFALLGAPGVARFASNPASIDRTTLGPLFDANPRRLLKLVPYLTRARRLPDSTVGGEACRTVRIEPLGIVRSMLHLPETSATLTLRASDSFPARVEVIAGARLHATAALHGSHVGGEIPASTWQLQPPEGTPVQRVALSHLTRFLESAYTTFGKKGAAPKPMEYAEAREAGAEKTSGKGDPIGAGSPTPAAPVSSTFITRYGDGRLELRGGRRILLLRGTPEQMGEQHGALLGREVRDVVARVLYGVGVGSSFANGEWFFGKIESCQARLAPFIDPRHLREMDALADAAGCEREEIRLANFFPELFHCSGFALLGGATEGGRIFHGRILDYMKGIGLEQNAVVIVSQPETGHAWVNIGYAGFIGSVTAMNEAGLSIGEMGGRGEGHWDGKPMAQLVREVMEKAGTLEEALDLMRRTPRTCEYYYVIADGKTRTAAGVKATPETFDVVRPGEAHPQLDTPIADTVVLSAGDRYRELTRRVQAGFGRFDAGSARDLMTRPVCMNSNIQSVLFAPDTLDFWVANATDGQPASHTPYAHYNLRELLGRKPGAPLAAKEVAQAK